MKRWQADLVRTFERIATMLEHIAIEMERYNERQERDTEADDE